MIDHLLVKKVSVSGSLSTVPGRCIGPSFNRSHQIFAIFYDLGTWQHYDWVHTYQINKGGKFKYLSKTAQRMTHLIISLYILLGNNLQRHKAFASDRKRPSGTNKHYQSDQCSKRQHARQ